MALRLFDAKDKNILFEKDTPDILFSEKQDTIQEHTIYFDHFGGKGSYREISFEGVHVGFGNTMLSNKVLLGFESDFETIEMHFSLKGKSSVKAEKFDAEISFDSHRHNIIYSNGMCGEMQWESEQFEICEINLSPEFFKKLLPQETSLFDKFRVSIEKGNSCLLNKKHFPINHQMYKVIDEIINCERKGFFKKLFLEAKIIELLLLQLEQFSEDSVYQHISLKKKDIDKIYAVKELILENLNADFSLIELAHQVGTNEFILKKGFKEIFGKTVFSFWTDMKMQQARGLLIERNLNIGEIAHLIGYKNQRHFSAAFKKKYGILPSQLTK